MPAWLVVVLAGVVALVGLWGALLLVARRLPPGTAREVVGFLPNCVTLLRRLRRDPRVPRSAKVAIVLAAVWVASPVDLVPEFLPVIGPLDDAVVVALALRWAARRVDPDVLDEAWPGDPAVLARLTGRR